MYYEDFEVGQKFFIDPITFTEEEIIRFAEENDPLPIHTDPEFAQNGFFGGLIASGFHTLCAIHTKFIQSRITSEEVICGLGFDFLQWSAPVRPGDTLRAEMELIEKIPSSKEGRGIIVYRVTAWNQEEQVVITFQVKSLIKTRE